MQLCDDHVPMTLTGMPCGIIVIGEMHTWGLGRAVVDGTAVRVVCTMRESFDGKVVVDHATRCF